MIASTSVSIESQTVVKVAGALLNVVQKKGAEQEYVVDDEVWR